MQWEKYYAQTADVPMMHVGGWYDIYLRGTIENWRRLGALKKSPMRLRHRALDAPRQHRHFRGRCGFRRRRGDQGFRHEFPSGAGLTTILKGIKTAASTQAPVRYFLMGTGDGHKDCGRTAVSRRRVAGIKGMAARRGARRRFFICMRDGSLNTTAPVPPEPAATALQFDPAHPVPTIGGGVSKRLKDGAYDQRERADMPGSRPPYLPLRARSDVLVFESEILKQDARAGGTRGSHAVRLFDGDGHRFHREAHRRVSAQRRLSDRIRYESNRWHRARKLSRPFRDARICSFRAKFTASSSDRSIPPTWSRRAIASRLDISSSNFPRFRCQSEYRRAARA